MQARTPKRAGLIELLLLALKRRRRFRIAGNSMLPLLRPEDQVLIRPRPELLRAGDIVLVRHPSREMILAKQIDTVSADGKLVLIGANEAESTDSRHFGAVEQERVLGVVTAIL